MKVLFLDIDGVVNCKTTTQRSRGCIGIDPYMAFLVGKIVLETDCKVVLSSSWRHFKGGYDEVESQVVKLFDKTGNSVDGFRGKEIKAWLDEHNWVTKYAILDDDSDMLPEQMLNFFQTSWDTGITEEIMQKVIAHLNS